jgi:hypothetical protein
LPQARSARPGCDHLKAKADDDDRDHIKVPSLSGRFGRFVHQRWRTREGPSELGARKDVTGIPVSVLLPGVEA